MALKGGDASSGTRRAPRRVSLPGFVPEEPVGLGDVLKRATTSIGIKPCSPCAARAQWLNNRVVFVARGE